MPGGRPSPPIDSPASGCKGWHWKYLRQLSPNPLSEAGPIESEVRSQVCLRGYTYFYLPWRRYRINLEATGVTALGLAELPLTGSCWDDQ